MAGEQTRTRLRRNKVLARSEPGHWHLLYRILIPGRVPDTAALERTQVISAPDALCLQNAGPAGSRT